MLGHVLILPNWKEFVFHRGCLLNLTSILNAGLITGGREGRETRHTVFFTPLDPWCTEEQEEYCDDLTKPRKSSWQNRLEALSRRGLCHPSWERTRERHDFLPNEIACSRHRQHGVEHVISQRGKYFFYQRSSSPRLSPRIVLKCAWHEQHQQQQQVVLRSRGKLLVGYCPEAPRLKQCCERRRWLVSSRSSSSWRITRRHLQRRGADDRGAKIG